MNRIVHQLKRGPYWWRFISFLISLLFISTFIFIISRLCQKVFFYQHSLDSNDLPQSNLWKEFCAEVTRRTAFEQQNPLRNISIRIRPSRPIPYSYSQWRSSPNLPRALTACEHAIYIDLIKLIVTLFHKHNISYTMMAATLLGNIFEKSQCFFLVHLKEFCVIPFWAIEWVILLPNFVLYR